MIKFRLNEILKEKDMSISTLSQKTGISRPSLSSMSNNTSRSVNLDFLEKIMSVLDVELTDIIYEEINNINIFYKLIKEKFSYIFYILAETSNKKNIYEDNVTFISHKDYLEDFGLLKRENTLLPEIQSYSFASADSKIHNTMDSNSFALSIENSDSFLVFLDTIGKNNTYKLLTTLINKSLVKEDLNFDEILTISDGKNLFYFTFDDKRAIPINNHVKNSEKYPSISLCELETYPIKK